MVALVQQLSYHPRRRSKNVRKRRQGNDLIGSSAAGPRVFPGRLCIIYTTPCNAAGPEATRTTRRWAWRTARPALQAVFRSQVKSTPHPPGMRGGGTEG
jgi:hypothetical protein